MIRDQPHPPTLTSPPNTHHSLPLHRNRSVWNNWSNDFRSTYSAIGFEFRSIFKILTPSEVVPFRLQNSDRYTLNISKAVQSKASSGISHLSLSLSSFSLPSFMVQGLSSMGQPYLTEEQFSLLCQQYYDPKRKDYVCWKKFLQDVDQGECDACYWFSQMQQVHVFVCSIFPTCWNTKLAETWNYQL